MISRFGVVRNLTVLGTHTLMGLVSLACLATMDRTVHPVTPGLRLLVVGMVVVAPLVVTGLLAVRCRVSDAEATPSLTWRGLLAACALASVLTGWIINQREREIQWQIHLELAALHAQQRADEQRGLAELAVLRPDDPLARWLPALACPVLLSFLTYASTSHDLVHRNLRLPGWLNEALLCAIELLAFRSGHAFRAVHLNHHAHFPADDDLEGAAAGMSWPRALLDGVTLQYRLWIFALRRPGRHRWWVAGEGATVLGLLAGCASLWPVTPWPLVYAALMVMGSWVYPFATVYVVHDANGHGELRQTRLFRGRVLSLLAMEHLYHLEHHLYPQVPHHNWPRLARRLDPYFTRLGLEPIKLLF